MKNRLWRWLAAALFIAPAILGLGAGSAQAAGNGVPLRASFSGTAVFGSDGTPLFSGTGNATHMGRLTDAGHVVFTAAPVTCAGGVPNDNYETLTAANGDAFTIVSHDVACPTGPNQYHGTGAWEVIADSGTGRFAGVSGAGQFEGDSDFGEGVFSIQLTGTISAP
jgi:hypothetical protein